MLLKRVSHSRALPTDITSHQMVSVSRIIHGHVSEAIEPLLETKPKYHAMNEILGTVGQAINQLASIQRRRKVKSPQDMRGTGGKDGLVGPSQVSQRKKTAYLARQTHMRRLGQAIEWQLMDTTQPDTDLTPEQIAAVTLLNQMLERRINRFESMNYEESHTEFDNFIADIEAEPSGTDMSGSDALVLLGQSRLYQRMKTQHAAYIDIHKEQTQLDALREESPKFERSTSELRRAIRVLLTNIHFDIENGDDTLAKVLGDIDEVIDKARAVGKRRETIAEQKAQQGQNGNTSGGSAPDSTDPTDAPNQTDETDQTDKSNAPDASVAPDASTSDLSASGQCPCNRNRGDAGLKQSLYENNLGKMLARDRKVTCQF